ncbi:hypothetical protein WJ02_28095 [Burkholderia vietnamiensis]|nr:hypothetical protein WJ02_28095 [Burkholderia vietnamiensis]
MLLDMFFKFARYEYPSWIFMYFEDGDILNLLITKNQLPDERAFIVHHVLRSFKIDCAANDASYVKPPQVGESVVNGQYLASPLKQITQGFESIFCKNKE